MYFVLLSGWIALSVLLDDGECQILDFCVPGAFLGVSQASSTVQPSSAVQASSTVMYHSARCLTAVQVRGYPRKQMDSAIENNAKLASALRRLAAFDAARAHDHLVNLGLRGARERIAHLLLELYARLRGHFPDTAGETVQLPLTQSHIAQAVGLTGVHVSRTLRILREQGIARYVNHDLEILDPDALIRAAGLESRSWDDPLERRCSKMMSHAPMRIAVPTSRPMPLGWEFQPDAVMS
jgi:CRP/FNR family transcriptional regulator